MPSLAELDIAGLPPRYRQIFDLVALPVSEKVTYDELAEALEVPQSAVAQAMSELRDYMHAKHYGATVPPMRRDDYEALKDSIQEVGQLVPILMDENGEVIAGENRLRACRELGIEPLVTTLDLRGLEPDPERRKHLRRRLALAENMARRQLTTNDKRKIVEAELIHDPSTSDRQIAKLVGVSHTTVQNVRRELEIRGDVARFATRRDALGRLQGAKPPRPPKPVVPNPDPAPGQQGAPPGPAITQVPAEEKVNPADVLFPVNGLPELERKWYTVEIVTDDPFGLAMVGEGRVTQITVNDEAGFVFAAGVVGEEVPA